MNKGNFGVVKKGKDEGQGAKSVVLQTHNLTTPPRPQDVSKTARAITTHDTKGKK